MAGSVNTVTLIGRVGSVPANSRTQGDSCSFSLATSERWTDDQGRRQESTDWHRVRCRGKIAELARSFVDTGDLLGVVGRLSVYDIDDEKKGRRRVVEVLAGRFIFMEPRPERRRG